MSSRLPCIGALVLFSFGNLAQAQNTADSEPAPSFHFNNGNDFAPAASLPTPPPPSPSGGIQAMSSQSNSVIDRSKRSLTFSELPLLSVNDLASIPNDILEATERRVHLLAQERAAAPPNNQKYEPNRASAKDLVDFPTPKIQAIADRLNGDPVEIFKFVRDQIRTEHQPKANKGAHMTLVLGSGGAGDKAALLYSLFRASGKIPGDDIRYVSARVKIPLFSKYCFSLAGLTGWSSQNAQQGLPTASELAGLLGLANVERNSIASILKSNLWSMRSVPNAENHIVADRVWVKVRINGEWIHLDPAFPRRRWLDVPQANIPVIPAYDHNAFLNAFAANPPAASALIPNAGNVHRVGFSNLAEVKRRMKQYSDALYDQFRLGGDKANVSMNDILGFLQEEHPEVEDVADLKLFGLPWRVGALGAGITDVVPTSTQLTGYPQESDFFPVEDHAWTLSWGWGQDGDLARTRKIQGWTVCSSFLMPAMMGKSLTMEQNGVNPNVSGIATLRLGGEEIFRETNQGYGLGTNGAGICVLAIEGLPKYPAFNATAPSDGFVTNGTRQRISNTNQSPASDFSPYSVFIPSALYLHSWSYLNTFSEAYLAECGERMSQLRDQGVLDTSIQMQLESLNLMIASYGYQYGKVLDLTSGLSQASSDCLYRIASGGFIDGRVTVDFQTVSLGHNFARYDGFNPYQSWHRVLGWLASGLEHSVVQQAQDGSTNKAFSTAKFLAKSNTSQPIYVLGPELGNPTFGASSADVTRVNNATNKYQSIIQTYVTHGVPGEVSNDATALYSLLMPHQNGSVRDGLTGWYVFAAEPFYGYTIGSAKGGLSGLLSKINPVDLLSRFLSGLAQGLSGVSNPHGGEAGSVANPNSPNAHGNDPIDMRTGAYISETTDLSVRGQPELVFTRYYNSGKALDRSGKMGYGWTHNHLKRLAIRSGLGAQFGESGRPEDAASMIAAILVLKELIATAAEDTKLSTRPAGAANRPAKLFWNRTRSLIAASCVATWATDELVDSDAILSIGDTDYRFSRIAKEDGDYLKNVSYRSPLGLPEWKLIRNAAGTYSLERRYAGRMTFSPLKTDGYHYCTKDEDAYGNALDYIVDAYGRITRISSNPQGTSTDPYLTLTYLDAERLSKVTASTDSARLQLGYRTATDSKKYLLEAAQPPVCATAAHKYVYAYEPGNRLITTTDPQSRVVMQNFYGGDGRVQRQRSQGLATQEWKYEWLPGMSKEINPQGHTTEFHYDARSRLIGVRDNEGKLTSYGLDDEDRIVAVYGPASELLSERTFYSALAWNRANGYTDPLNANFRDPDVDPREGVLLSETQHGVWNASSTQTSINFSLVTHTTPQNIITTYEYENTSEWHKGLPTKISTTGSEPTVLKYKFGTTAAPGRDPAPEQMVGPQNRTTTFTRDLRGNVTKEDTSDGSFTYTFDTRGRLIQESKLRGSTETPSTTFYNWAHEPHTLSGPSAMLESRTGLGFITSLVAYQTLPEPAAAAANPASIPVIVVQKLSGQMQKNTAGVISFAALGSTYSQTTFYNAFGDVIRTEDGHGDDLFPRVVSHQYNALGKLIRTVGSQTEAGTPVSSIGYDERGWQKTATDPLNRTVTTTRQFLDRPDVITNPLNHRVTTEFDSLGRVQKVISPMLRETKTTHVGFSSLPSTTTDALNQVTTSWHNAQGKLVAMTDRNGKQWRFAYDSLGRPKATLKPTGEMIRQHWYTNRDVLNTVVEPSGQTTQFLEYNSDNCLLRKKDGVNSGNSETVLGYDAGLQLSSLTENGQTISRVYDYANQGQLSRITNARGEVFDYVYGSDGLLRGVIYPVDKEMTVTMPDSTTRLLTISTPFRTNRKSVRYEYDSHKRLIKVIDWANRTTQYKYDIAGRLKKIIRHNGSVCDMDYDPIDRLKEIKDSWVADGRLISLFRFGFNDDSHLTSRLARPYPYGTAGTPFNAAYGPDNRLLTVNGQATTHDLDGNLLTSPDPLDSRNMSLAYDTRNRLVTGTVRGVSSSYTYDAEGVRQTATFGGQTTTYTSSTHAPLSQVLKRVGPGGKVTWCVYGLGLLYEVEPDLGAMTAVPNSNPVRYTALEKTLVHHHDQIGNTVAVTDDQQRDVLWVQYDVYGAVVHAESPPQRSGAAPVRPEINLMPDKHTRALAVTPFLFSGQQGVITDPNGLLYMRARYYHPGLRRFVNPDPIGFEGGNNWYAYAGSNPLMANDPSGLILINMFSPTEVAYTNVQAHPYANHPTILVIGGHGSNKSISYNGNTEMTSGTSMKPNALLKFINDHPSFPGWDKITETFFISCNVGNTQGHPSEQKFGNSPTSNPFARLWAALTGKPATGADNFGWPKANGDYFVGPPTNPKEPKTSKWEPDYSKPGQLIRFEADGSSHSIGLPRYRNNLQKIGDFFSHLFNRGKSSPPNPK